MFLFNLPPMLLVVATSATASPSACLHTVRDAQTIPYSQVSNPIRFDMVATALNYDEISFTVLDDGIGIDLENYLTNNLVWNPGDIIRVRGEMTVNPEERRIPKVRQLDIVGHRELPAPARATGGDILSGALDFRAATVEGVVQAVFKDDFDKRYNWIALNTPYGIVMAATRESNIPVSEIHRLIDAEVSLTGLVKPGAGRRVGFTSFLSIRSTNCIRIARAAPADPFASAADSDTDALHRKVFLGSVLARTNDRYFLRTTTGRFIEAKPQSGSVLPAPGECIRIAGFPELEGTRLRLVESVFRTETVTSEPEIPTVNISLNRLFDRTDKIIYVNPEFHGMLVRLQGRVTQSFSHDMDDRSFGLTDGRDLVLIDCSSLTPFTKPPESSLAEIDGILLAEYEPVLSAVKFPVFRNFRLVPRNPADVRILEHPPWWTPVRLLALILLLVLVIFGIIIWNRTLNARANRRGAELAHEQIAHRAASLKVEERTQLAVEIHDAISQTLTGIALLFDSMADEATTPSLKRFFAVARQMLASCRRELKDCLWDLRTRTFEEKDMTEAIRLALQPFADKARLQIRFNVPRESLSESLAHDILRIVRELVTNALLHGQAKNVHVAGTREGELIHFLVEDNGCGFHPETALGPYDGHFGLQGIRERVKAHRGTIEFASARPHGTRIRIILNTGGEDNDEG